MTIQAQVGEVTTNHASGTVMIDGSREYFIFVGKSFISVANGNAIRLRSPGKSFQSAESVAKHYKKDGVALREVVTELAQMRGDCR